MVDRWLRCWDKIEKREREFLFRSPAKLYGGLTGGAVQEGRKERPTVAEIVFAAESIFLHNQRSWQDSFVSIDFLAVYLYNLIERPTPKGKTQDDLAELRLLQFPSVSIKRANCGNIIFRAGPSRKIIYTSAKITLSSPSGLYIYLCSIMHF